MKGSVESTLRLQKLNTGPRAETEHGNVHLLFPRESRGVARSACSASSNERSADRSRQTHAAPSRGSSPLTRWEVSTSILWHVPSVPRYARAAAVFSGGLSAEIRIWVHLEKCFFHDGYEMKNSIMTRKKEELPFSCRVRINASTEPRSFGGHGGIPLRQLCGMRAEWSLNLHLWVRMASGLVSLVQRA